MLPTVNISDLEGNRKYMISKFKQVQTKHGSKLIAELNLSFQVFLPKGVSDNIVNDEAYLKKMQSTVVKGGLFLSYKGGCIEFSDKFCY